MSAKRHPSFRRDADALPASPLWKWTERLNGEAKKMREAAAFMDAFLYGAIDQKEKAGLWVGAKDTDSDLLSAYMSQRDDNGQQLSKKFIR